MLKLIVTAAVTVVSLASLGEAATVKAAYTGATPSLTVSTSVKVRNLDTADPSDFVSKSYSGPTGVYNWNGAPYAASNPTQFDGKFTSFCIDLKDTFSNTTSWKLGALEQAPVDNGAGAGVNNGLGGGMGSFRADLIRELFGRFYYTAIQSNIGAAALQLAIWEIVYEDYTASFVGLSTSLDVGSFNGGDWSSGGFKETRNTASNGSARTQANTWLDSLNGTGPKANLVALLSGGSYDKQDQVVLVPAPEAVVGGVLLLGLIGAVRFARSRRTNGLE